MPALAVENGVYLWSSVQGSKGLKSRGSRRGYAFLAFGCKGMYVYIYIYVYIEGFHM